MLANESTEQLAFSEASQLGLGAEICLLQAEQGEPAHDLVKEFARQQYGEHFHCELETFMPSSLSLYRGGELIACTGFQSAEKANLYLEQYLPLAIEVHSSIALDKQVSRNSIVEIGGFAVKDSTSALLFMQHLAPWFYEQQFDIAACTATSKIRCLFRQLGIKTSTLTIASETQLDGIRQNWGDYYENSPRVMLGDIRQTLLDWGLDEPTTEKL